MMAILEELTESLEENDIKDLLSWYSNKSVLQRMGFLIEEMSSNENIQSLLFGLSITHPFFLYYSVRIKVKKRVPRVIAGKWMLIKL